MHYPNAAALPASYEEPSAAELPANDDDTGFRIRATGEATRESRRAKRAQRRAAALARLEDPRVAAVTRVLRESFEKRPVATVAVALGLGFLIGGGLSTRFGRAALMSVARYAARELLRGGIPT